MYRLIYYIKKKKPLMRESNLEIQQIHHASVGTCESMFSTMLQIFSFSGQLILRSSSIKGSNQ